MTDTIRVKNRNNSLYVTISTALLSKRARVSCGDLCVAEAPTEAAAEKKVPSEKRELTVHHFRSTLFQMHYSIIYKRFQVQSAACVKI